MNKKKLIGNLLLIALVVGLSLTFFEPGKADRTYQEQIQAFILDKLEQAGESVDYTPLSFEEVNESFLLAREDIKQPMGIIEDTIKSQLSLMRKQYVSAEVNRLIYEAEEQLKDLSLSTVADYLALDARLKRSIKQADVLSSEIRADLYLEESRMMDAINQLGSAVSQFNLSVFNIDFERAETVLYYHTFRLKDNRGNTDHAAVFELGKENKEIISFKNI